MTISYFFTPGLTSTELEISNNGYLLDSIYGNETELYPEITISLTVCNPEPSLPYYPNISLINTLFDLTELITQMGIKNILKKSDCTILKASNNAISFCANPLYLKKILNEIYDYYSSIIGSCKYVSLSARIKTEPYENNEYVKLNTMSKKKLIFIFNNFLKWDEVFELFDQAKFLSNFYQRCNNTEKQSFINFVKNTLKNKFFNVSQLLNSIDDKDAYEYFINVNNPFLLTKLIDMIIEKE